MGDETYGAGTRDLRYEEEFEERTIAPAPSGSDFAYHRDGARGGAFVYADALRHFGLTDADVEARAAAYADVQREQDSARSARNAAAAAAAAGAAPDASARAASLSRDAVALGANRAALEGLVGARRPPTEPEIRKALGPWAM